MWQWINQTYNAAFNYHNRNTTSSQTTKEIIGAYGMASSLSVATAVGLNTLVKKHYFKYYLVKLVSYRFVPFFACCAASSFNATIMRYKELKNGVELCDSEGNSYGISKRAGRHVIKSIIMSRVLLQVPSVLLPSFLIYMFKYLKLTPTGKIPAFLFDSVLVAFSCTVALPIAVSLFPEHMKIKTGNLEEEFRNIQDERGRVIKQFIVSKGV